MTIEEEARLPSSIRDYAHQIDDDLVLGIKRPGETQPVDHFNHSCEPNAGFEGQITLVAMRGIAPGEEVTIDYAMVLSQATTVEPYRLDCRCGTASCRKIVTDLDWMRHDLQERYAGYFSFHIARKIDRTRRA